MKFHHGFKKVVLMLSSAYAIIWLSGCENTSIVDVNGPEDIRLSVTLVNNYYYDTDSYTNAVHCELMQEDGSYIQLDNGEIYVNGHIMNHPRDIDKTYYSSDITVEPDSLYSFEIVLNNSDVYGAWVRTPTASFTYIDVPDRFPRNTSMTVHWKKVDYKYPQRLLVQYLSSSDGFSEEDQVALKIYYPYDGKYTISKDHIQYTDYDIYEAAETRIILVAEEYGAVENDFASGSSIEARIQLIKDVEIY